MFNGFTNVNAFNAALCLSVTFEGFCVRKGEVYPCACYVMP